MEAPFPFKVEVSRETPFLPVWAVRLPDAPPCPPPISHGWTVPARAPSLSLVPGSLAGTFRVISTAGSRLFY